MTTCTSNCSTIKTTIGCDVGDRKTTVCVLEGDGVVERKTISTSETAIRKHFSRERCHIVMEVGAHSRWLSRLLESLGHRVTLANPRQVKLIAKARRKSDRRDAELLGRLGQADVQLLAPVEHRSEEAQSKLAVLKARELLVESRTRTIVHIRGVLKAAGIRLTKCDAKYFAKRQREHVPQVYQQALGPLFDQLDMLGKQIGAYDKQIKQMAAEHRGASLMMQIQGVGVLSALAFALSIDDPKRFSKSREVGAYLGLVPRQRQSGDIDADLHITKAGDPFVRKMLVNAANYVLGPFAHDSDLRSYGLRVASRGGKRPGQRAKVAVARKLAVLMHRLWLTGEVYEPIGYRTKSMAA